MMDGGLARRHFFLNRGWHWQLVASVAQQQEVMNRATDKADRNKITPAAAYAAQNYR
jgi:hypothetical protein